MSDGTVCSHTVGQDNIFHSTKYDTNIFRVGGAGNVRVNVFLRSLTEYLGRVLVQTQELIANELPTCFII